MADDRYTLDVTFEAGLVSPASAEGRQRLVVLTSTGGVLEFDLGDRGDLTVGRSPNAEIHVDSRSISRAHALLTVSGNNVWVRDLKSTNGTFVNGTRLGDEPMPIEPGDALRFGEVMAQVRASRSSMMMSASFVPASQLDQQLGEEGERCLRYDHSLAILALESQATDRATAERTRAIICSSLRALDAAAERAPGRIDALVRECSREEAVEIARRLASALRDGGVDARIGVASFPNDVPSVDSLAVAAQMAMHSADGDVGVARDGARQLKLGDREVIVAEPAMTRLFALVERTAAAPIPVLVHGETGSGKEIVAEAIHRLGPRASRRLVTINCAAVPENLLESELFGHERGAFSGADAAKPGLYEQADGGTLLLDEIGEMPLALQAKLLRVLEDGRVRRLGATRDVKIDVRVVAVTHRDLRAAVEEGRFRQDLYFRLSAVVLEVPPLRQRPREIPLLAERFAAQVAAQMGRAAPGIAPEALDALMGHAWPGNIRELHNALGAAVMVCDGSMIERRHLDPEITRDSDAGLAPIPRPAPSDVTRPVRAPTTPGRDPPDVFRPLEEEIRELERTRIRQALDRCGGNQTRAAELLDMPRRTFVNKLKSLEIDVPRRRTSKV